MNRNKTFLGLFFFVSGIVMMFFDQTRGIGGFAIGFGASISAMGVTQQNDKEKRK